MTSLRELILPAFMDMHVHLREGSQLQYLAYCSQTWCDTVVAMPNLKDPLTNPTKIAKYREEIGKYSPWVPRRVIIPLYLTPDTTPSDIFSAWANGVICAKAYPRGRTSHSQHGIIDFRALEFTYRAMGEVGMKLLIHPEHPGYDSWEAEEKFFLHIWPYLRDLVSQDFGLKISLEHISTKEGVWAIERFGSDDVVGTITPHHLLAYIGDLVDGLDSAYYCKPVLKQRYDQRILRYAMKSASPYFLLGSDSAPWDEHDKDKRSPCAGCWTAPWLPQLLATVFSEEDCLNNLQAFTHDNAVKWWGLEPAQRKIKIFQREMLIPDESLDPYYEENRYFPFLGDRTLPWDAAQVFSDEGN